jgi:anti-sigma factor RsiW
MMNCGGEWNAHMHRVLDHEASKDEEQKLKEHLTECQQCQKHFMELKYINKLLEDHESSKAPEGFTSKVLERLPEREQKHTKKFKWVRKYPMLTAAAIFIILMASTLVSQWNIQENHQVSYEANGATLIVDEETDTVIVPKDITVQGDLIVRNGNVQVDGSVHGDVIIIRGEYMASAGNVVGESEEIKKITEWVWYSIKNIFQ